ncbi:MAG: hypothetical protein FWF67_07295 [Fibromonadales bacterium]|nr:hypothetical protein [Fibromonadales bacterium]
MEFLLILVLAVLIGGGASSSSSSSSSKGRKKDTTVIYNQPQPNYQQPQQPVIIYQQAPPQQPVPQQAAPQQPPPQQPVPQPAPAVQEKAKGNSSIRSFAVKSYDKIVKDNQKGKGDHLNSLILLLESEGIPKDESMLLIKKAIRKSNGNAEIFGDEIENSL